ncbi:MAG: stage V sporulation protein AB [Chloroflexi bacterium]|nr:stage V sporulation protein AB [Chloroflexota bacterium]
MKEKRSWSLGVGNFILFGLFAGIFILIGRANLSDTNRRGLEVATILVFGSLFYLFEEAAYMVELQKKHSQEHEPAPSLPAEPDAEHLFDLYYRIDLPAKKSTHNADVYSSPDEHQER